MLDVLVINSSQPVKTKEFQATIILFEILPLSILLAIIFIIASLDYFLDYRQCENPKAHNFRHK